MNITFLYDKGRLFPQEKDRLQIFKNKLKPGDLVTAFFEKGAGSRNEKQSRLFHALRDAYARETGYSMPDAKHELKYNFGIHLPVCEETLLHPPTWEGQIIEMYGTLIFMKSTRFYNKTEWSHLIDGTKQACLDVGVDLATVEGAV